MLVRSHMSKNPITINRNRVYSDAFDVMEKGNLHHIPVVDEKDRIVGILTQRDLHLAAQYFKEAPVEVSEVMHSPVVTISQDELLADAARKMVDHRLGALPVVDGEHRLTGIITEVDMLRVLTNVLDRMGQAGSQEPVRELRP